MREGWEYKKLGEVASYINGYAFKPEQWKEDGTPIVRIQNLNNPNAPYNYYDGEVPEKVIINNGDLLISWSASLGAYIWQGGRAFLNQHIFKVCLDKTDIDKMYLKYAVTSKLDAMAGQVHGATMKHIVKKDFDNTKIPYPPTNIQQSIVSELDKINELIRLKKEQLKDYDNLAQSIFYEMFGDPVVNEKGWEVKKLGEVCKFTQGTQVPLEEQHLSKENGLVQFLRIIDFTQGKDAPRFIKSPNEKYILHEREIAIVRYGTPGFVCYGKIGAIANNLFKITPNQKDMFEFEFLVHWLNTEAFQSAVKSKQYGAALQAIKFSTIQGINIIIPTLTVQRSFATRISQIDKQKQYIKESIKDLETLLASRMQYWFD